LSHIIWPRWDLIDSIRPRLGKVGSGSSEIAFGRFCAAPFDIGPGGHKVIRVEPDGLIEVLNGAVVLRDC
jgi:hypothetical protein